MRTYASHIILYLQRLLQILLMCWFGNNPQTSKIHNNNVISPVEVWGPSSNQWKDPSFLNWGILWRKASVPETNQDCVRGHRPPTGIQSLIPITLSLTHVHQILHFNHQQQWKPLGRKKGHCTDLRSTRKVFSRIAVLSS